MSISGKLMVGIYRDSDLVGTVELRDPREDYVAEFNNLNEGSGLEAKSLADIECNSSCQI